MQKGRHVDQEVDRFDRLGVVHQSGPQRHTRVIDTGLVAIEILAMLSLLNLCSAARLTDEHQTLSDHDPFPSQPAMS
jgi:hypothetical protein